MAGMVDYEKVREVIVDARISKVLSLRTDSIAMTEALEAIGEFYESNTSTARQSLRHSLEMRTVDCGKRFLHEMEAIKNRLDAVDKFASHLHSSCVSLAGKVEEADRNVKAFMDKANQLESKRGLLLSQSEEVAQFLSRYHMNSSEIRQLQTANLDNSSEARGFFTTFQKLKAAYADCKAITEKQFYGIGFELLDVLGKHKEMALERLFEWLRQRCEGLAENSSTNPSAAINNQDQSSGHQLPAQKILSSQQLQAQNYLYSQLGTAARLLRDVPGYLEQCQDLLIAARRTQLVQRFMAVAVQGYHGTGAKALVDIQQAAAEPVSFLGGLLAWIHMAIAAELEFFASIHGDQSDSDSHTPSSVLAPAPVITAITGGFTMEELLVRAVQGLGRPLRLRILQLLDTHPGQLDTLFALADLLSFYQQTFWRVLAVENAVHSAVKGSLGECQRVLQAQLRRHATAAKNSPAPHSSDLKASLLTRECAQQVKAILKAASFALASSSSASVDSMTVKLPLSITSTDEADTAVATAAVASFQLENVLGELIQPVLQACRSGGQSLQAAETAVYMLNNVNALQAGFAASSASSSGGVKSMLASEADSWAAILVAEETSRILRRSDLDRLVELVDALPSGLQASAQLGLDQDRVETVLRAFYASLFSTVSSQLDRLQDPQLRDVIRGRISAKVSEAYAKIHVIVSDPQHGYSSSSSNILQHDVEGVNMLLGNL